MRPPTLGDVELRDYDFFDFGAGIGGSLEFCKKRFKAKRGLGIEINRNKIIEARTLGREVVLGDIRSLPEEARVRFVSMMDFLEHLPSYEDVYGMLEVAVTRATDFVYIRHPSFEDEAYLAALGFRQYWQGWSVHPAHLLLSDFAGMFERLGVRAWTVRFKDPAYSSEDDTIIPLGAPKDHHHYDPETCGPKESISFAKPVYRQLHILVLLSVEAFESAVPLLAAAAGP